MPYINTTPIDMLFKIDEDNAIEQIGQLLVDNGWTFVKNFKKVATDTRAYHRAGEPRTSYAFADHYLYCNAEGRLLGIANTGFYSIYFKVNYGETIRRPYDSEDENDGNFGLEPDWNSWARQRLADTVSNNRMYFYMLEKAPSDESIPNGGMISTVVMPGMSKTRLDPNRDRDEGSFSYEYDWKKGSSSVKYKQLDKDGEDLEFNGKILSASEEYLIEAALDIEVHRTTWLEDDKEVRIDYAEPRIMQSPYVEVALRSDLVEYIDNPIQYSNWWTDSEIRLKGYVDSKTMNVIIQSDTAPKFDGNVTPNVPIYFGKIIPILGESTQEGEPGYALFGGGVPDARNTALSASKLGTYISPHYSGDWAKVTDISALPSIGSIVKVGNTFYAELTDVDPNTSNIKYRVLVMADGKAFSGGSMRLQQRRRIREASTDELPESLINELGIELDSIGTGLPHSENDSMVDTGTLANIAKYDFDTMKDLKTVPKMPILKTYNEYPSDGIFSVMCSKTRFGSRYQRHYLSWGTTTNSLPPGRNIDGKMYPDAINPMENTENYKYQFNASRYSGKVHATPVYIVHPEEGVRGYLEYAIGFNPQSTASSALRVSKGHCEEEAFDIYESNVVSAVSPLTKRPATTFRPMGYGILKETTNKFLKRYDPTEDKEPPSEVIITLVDTSDERSVLVKWDRPLEEDYFGVNVYCNGKLYAKNVSGIDSYLLTGFKSKEEVSVEIETIDLAGNVSTTRAVAETVTIQ